MKQVAGRLRINLAQYRELAAFSQFSSDLDKTTRTLLTSGERLVEILKQDQYRPLPVEKQIAAIYAGVYGFLDDLPLDRVRPFIEGLQRFMDREHPDLNELLRHGNVWDDSLQSRMNTMIENFKKQFA